MPLTVILEFTRGRYSDSMGFLTEILSDSFGLTAIDPWAGVKSVSVEDVLAGLANEDWMLMLSR